MGYPATSSGLPPGYDTTAPQRYPKVGPPQGFSQRLSETPTEHQQPHTQLLQQQQLQRRQQQQEQQQQEQQQQELQQQRKQQQQQQQQQLQRQQQQQQQQQQQLQRQQQQHQQQQQLQQQRQQQSQQQQRQQQQKHKQRGAAGAGHLSPLPNGHQSSAPTYAEDPSMGLPYDAAQRVLQTQQAVADQLRNGPPHGVLQTGNRRRAVTPADGYLQQMGGVNTSVTANNSHGQGPGQYQEPNDPWTGTVHPGNNVFPQGGFHAHAPYYQPQQSPLPTAAAAAALGGAVAVAHEASGTIVYNSRETSPLVQPALDMSAVGRAPSVAGGRGASLAAAQSQSVDKGLLEALGMGEGGHRPPAQAGGLMPPSSQFQQRDGLGARSTVEPPELAWVTDHRGPVDRDRLLNGTERPAAGLGGLGQHYGDLRHASPPARFNDDSAYTENLEAAQMAARSLLPGDGRRAAARSAAEGMMHLGI